MMLKEFVKRMAVGFAASIFVHMIITFCIEQAGRSIVMPEFSALFVNETAAVVVQMMLVGLIGVAFSCGAMIFEIERWSYILQGVVHFAVTAAVWMPVAWMCWRPISGKAAVCSALGWLFTYAVNWFVQYLIYRARIKKLNVSISSFAEVDENE